MSDVEKRRAALVARCLNNLHVFYASLHTFLNFLITQKQKKKQCNSQDYLIDHLKIFQKEG